MDFVFNPGCILLVFASHESNSLFWADIPLLIVRCSSRCDRGVSDKNKEWTTTQNSLVHSNTEEAWIVFPALISNYSSKCFISSRRDCERLPPKHLLALCLGSNWSARSRANWSQRPELVTREQFIPALSVPKHLSQRTFCSCPLTWIKTFQQSILVEW